MEKNGNRHQTTTSFVPCCCEQYSSCQRRRPQGPWWQNISVNILTAWSMVIYAYIINLLIVYDHHMKTKVSNLSSFSSGMSNLVMAYMEKVSWSPFSFSSILNLNFSNYFLYQQEKDFEPTGSCALKWNRRSWEPLVDLFQFWMRRG